MNIFQEKEIEKIAARNGVSKEIVVAIYHESCKTIKKAMNSVKRDEEGFWREDSFPIIKIPYIGKIIIDKNKYREATKVFKMKKHGKE